MPLPNRYYKKVIVTVTVTSNALPTFFYIHPNSQQILSRICYKFQILERQQISHRICNIWRCQ